MMCKHIFHDPIIPEKQIKITVCKHEPSFLMLNFQKVECMASYNVGIKFKQDDEFQSPFIHSADTHSLTVMS